MRFTIFTICDVSRESPNFQETRFIFQSESCQNKSVVHQVTTGGRFYDFTYSFHPHSVTAMYVNLKFPITLCYTAIFKLIRGSDSMKPFRGSGNKLSWSKLTLSVIRVSFFNTASCLYWDAVGHNEISLHNEWWF